MEKGKSKDLKYKWLIDEENLSDKCPFDGCDEQEREGFRFTFSNIKHDDNFLPVIVIDRKLGKPLRGIFKEDIMKCSGCGLSMFNTIDAAKARFNGFPNRTKMLFPYTHIATGLITKATGIVSPVNKYGHFDLFEYGGVNLSETYKIVGNLR